MTKPKIGVQIGLAGAMWAALFVPAPSHAGTGLVFVSNEKSHTLSVIDPKKQEVVREIETSSRPRTMRFSPTRDQILVACGDDDVIDVIDLKTLEVVDHIPTGPSPEAFAFSADGKTIFVSNEEDSMLEVIDVAEKIVVHDIPTGAEPEGVIVSEDGATVYVTSEVADMVHVIDPVGGFVIKNIIVGTRPRRFALTPDGKELWVTAELSGEVYVIDRETLKIKDVITFLPPGMRQEHVTPVGLRISKTGTFAIVTLGRANHVAFVDVASRKVEDYVLVGRRAWGKSVV